MGRKVRQVTARDPRLEPLEPRCTMSASPLFGELLTSSPEVTVVNAQSEQIDGYGSAGVDFAHDELGLAGLGQTIAIIDSGIAYDHYALGGGLGAEYRVVGGWDFAENDADPYDDAPGGFHGTHVAGIVGSDDVSLTGVAPQADLVALRVFDDQGDGEFAWIESALRWVHTHRHDFAYPITTVNLSVGCRWNGEEIPEWATLEDELAQLERDGIFISVSAGNHFRTEQTVGLNYPAVSPYVVPAASLNGDGQLSEFSQRHERVIAAPGELVTSTAPDYLYGFDGVTDDFVQASGTSMAAPYVAGASALVREAWQISGVDDVTQSTIYGHLRDTADTVYDPVTQSSYRRLNLEQALRGALPADDYGDSVTSSEYVGTIQTTTTVHGMFTACSDQDFVSFVAGATGEVSVVTQGSDYVSPAVRLAGTLGEGSSTLQFGVVAGQRYTVAFGTTAGIGQFEAQFELTASITDLGVVDALTLRQPPTRDGSQVYSWTAAHDGHLSVTGEQLGNGRLELYDAAGVLVSDVDLSRGRQGVVTEARAGDSYQLRISGTDQQGQVRLTNLVQVEGRAVRLYGTAGRDRFVIRAGTQISVSVHGETYALDRGFYSDVRLQDADHHDEIWVFGTDFSDTATVWSETAEIRGDHYQLDLSGATRYSLLGQGGRDQITMYDSVGKDVFVGREEYALLSGPTLRHVARGFEQVSARSVSGGGDRAILYDSQSDEQLTVTANEVTLRGSSFQWTGHGFATVAAVASSGGYDTAVFRDTAGDENFVGMRRLSLLQGDGFRHSAIGYDRVTAIAGGGSDRALLYASASGQDTLVSSSRLHTIAGLEYVTTVSQFDEVIVIGQTNGAGPGNGSGDGGDGVGTQVLRADTGLPRQLGGIAWVVGDPSFAWPGRDDLHARATNWSRWGDQETEPAASVDDSQTLPRDQVDRALLDGAVARPRQTRMDEMVDQRAQAAAGEEDPQAVWEAFGEF